MIASGGAWDGNVKVWDAQTGTCCATLCGYGGGVISVAISGDGSIVISHSAKIGEEVWDARTRARLGTGTEGANEIRTAFLSNNQCQGRILDGYLRIPNSDGVTPLIVFGPFDQACGSLMDDKFLAFNTYGEAFWFQIRRRQGS